MGEHTVCNPASAARPYTRTENGIAVNETLRTGTPTIFAAGDCCSLHLHFVAAAARNAEISTVLNVSDTIRVMQRWPRWITGVARCKLSAQSCD
jgi:pyruvate/2-oxoglutarate dehydrogenase complex dihydrolipoamide dehydrogenase (E3) component